MIVVSSHLFASLFASLFALGLAPGEPVVAEPESAAATSESAASESSSSTASESSEASAGEAVGQPATASSSTSATTSSSTATGTAEPAAIGAPSGSSVAGFSSSDPPPASPAATAAAPAYNAELPPEYGPFYEAEAPSDTAAPSDPRPGKPPFLSLGAGAFCFVEAAACRSAMIVSADVGAGINAIAGDRGVDLPMTQFSFRGGFTVRPVTLLRKRWHPWSVGLVGSFVRSSGTVASSSSTIGDTNPDLIDVAQTSGARVALLNQVWLSQKRHALHLDFSLGIVRSAVLTAPDQFIGTHADIAVGVGGWGALFLAGDFLDSDTRLAFGFRGHGIAAAPVATLVLLGLLAGGAL